MNKLIIGCGYLGQRVARLWRGQNHRVWAVTRTAATGENFRAQGIEPIVADVLDPAPWSNLPRFDTVLYAVGFDRGAGVGMREVYVDGLANVLDHLPRPGRFLYVSSTSVYGQTEGEWVDETSPTEPLEESGRIVLAAEEVFGKKFPEAVVMRFAGIYGPGRLMRQKTLEAGEPIVGDASKWLNLIHVDDGAQAIIDIATKAPSGTLYNICDGQPVCRRAFYDELARVLRVPPPRYVSPPPEQPTPPHEKGNRRLSNRLFVETFQPVFRYPDYRAGLAQSEPKEPRSPGGG